MGDIALRGPALKKSVEQAKKRILNFAYCPGNDPKEDVFVLDRKKSPDVIGRVARAEGTGTKAAIGTASVKGRVMTLTCFKEVPQAAKKLKKFLKSEKVPMNVIIMDKDGNVIEEDIEDLPDDPELDSDDDDDNNDIEDAAESENDDENEEEAAQSENAVNEAERLKKLTARAQALQTSIAGLPEAAQAPIMKRFKGVVGDLKSGDLDSADAKLTKLEEAVQVMAAKGNTAGEADADLAGLTQEADALARRIDALGNDQGTERLLKAHNILVGQIEAGEVNKASVTAKALADAIASFEAASTDPNVADQDDAQQDDDSDDEAVGLETAWRYARDDLEVVALDLLKRNLGDVGKMRAVLGYFIEKGEAGDFESGMKAAAGLRKLIADAQAAEQTAAEADVPAGVVPFVRARLDWVKTRSTLTSELTKLKRAIMDTCEQDDFPDMSRETDRLFDYLNKLDERLENALEALVEEPDGAKREKLKADAAKLLVEYQGELNTPFFKAVDDGNGFVSVKVRSSAVQSLGKVRSALSAAA